MSFEVTLQQRRWITFSVEAETMTEAEDEAIALCSRSGMIPIDSGATDYEYEVEEILPEPVVEA